MTRCWRAPARAIVLLLLAAVVNAASAQSDPAAVAREVLQADSMGDWSRLLRLAHPDALREFRALRVLQLRIMGDTTRQAGDRLDPELDSLQHHRFAERRIRYQRTVLDSVFLVRDVDALSRLAPDSVFARWMRASRAARDTTGAETPRSRARLVGVLRADDTLAYAVVVRTIPRLPGPLPEPFRDLPQPEESPEVMVLRRVGVEWRSMLDGTLAGEAGLADDPLSDE